MAAVLFRAGLRGAWRWTRERWQTAAFFASLLALLTVTLIGGRLFGFDSARTNFLLAYLYGSFGIAGLAWHLATLDEARLREENRA